MAYSSYQYGTSARKLDNDLVLERVKKTKNKIKTKAKEKAQINKKTILYLIVVFGILGTISVRNSFINEI